MHTRICQPATKAAQTMNCLLILFARGKTHLKDELGFERTYLHKLKLSAESGSGLRCRSGFPADRPGSCACAVWSLDGEGINSRWTKTIFSFCPSLVGRYLPFLMESFSFAFRTFWPNTFMEGNIFSTLKKHF